jgi:capsular exopolysaccharide synthesis family protein
MFSWATSLWDKMAGTRMVTPEEIEGALHLPVLAIIPHIERRKGLLPTQGPIMRRIDLEGRWRSRLLIHYPENSPAAATYASLVKELHALSRAQRQKVWLFAGSVSGEGASLTTMNLAISAQRLGIKSLIIEGHTRSPRISSVFRLELEPGLTGCLNRSLNAVQAIQKSNLAAVDVLPAGHAVPYPETLWGTPAFHRLLAEVRTLYELILFEAPPVLLYPDASILADKVDGIVLIHQFGRTSPQRVEKVLEKLGDRRDHVLGVLLNDVPMGLPSGQAGLH